jgi:hypothetical protein
VCLSFMPQQFNIRFLVKVLSVAYACGTLTLTAKAEQGLMKIDPIANQNAIGSLDNLVVATSMSGSRVTPSELFDGSGLIFKAKASYPVCAQASLEVEIIPSGRPFTGEPTIKSDFTQQCPLTGPCKALDVPSIEFMPPSGRVIKAQVRLRIKSNTVHFDDRGPVRCGVDVKERMTSWEPYSKWLPVPTETTPLMNIRDEWLNSVTYPTDSIIQKGESADELTDLRIGDGNWYTTKSTTTPPYEVQWMGHSSMIPNIDSATDGTVTMKVRSSPGCTQKIELQRSVGLGQKEWVEILPSVSIRPKVQTLTSKLPYDLRGFLWTAYQNEGRSGLMYWRITCVGKEPFTHEFDLLGISYRALGEVRSTD